MILAQGALERRGELAEVDGLADEVEGARAQGAHRRVGVGLARDDDDRQVGVLGAQLLAEVEAALAVEPDVGHHRVGGELAAAIPSSVAAMVWLVQVSKPCRRSRSASRSHRLGIVVHDQHGRAHAAFIIGTRGPRLEPI